MPEDQPTVFIVDDDALVRSAVQGMLRSVRLNAETFGTPQEFLSRRRTDGPSCLVLDVSHEVIREMNGLLCNDLTRHSISIEVTRSKWTILMSLSLARARATRVYSCHPKV
jgi:FixJ family two-component response regulator